jgi:hypothetical protein
MLPFAVILSTFLAAQTDAQSSSSRPESSAEDSDTTTISGSISGTITGGDVPPTSGVSYLSYSTTSTIRSSSIIGDASTISSSSSSASGTASSADSTSTSETLSLINGGGSNSTFAIGGATSTSTAAIPTNTQPCNNYPEFCSRKYSNITEITAHNSPFARRNNAASNQALDVIDQLNDGIRMIQGQTHMVNGTLHYCHTSCDLLDAGPVQDYLSTVTGWVEDHPFDVLTILIGNGDISPVEDFIDPIQNSGLSQYLYIPPQVPMGLDDWPTLSQMILTKKRVVLFMDYNANQTSVPYILDQFSQLWETPFDPTNRSFPCTVDRPPNLDRQAAKERMYLVNHNLNVQLTFGDTSFLTPNTGALNVTNNVSAAGEGSLGWNAANCSCE